MFRSHSQEDYSNEELNGLARIIISDKIFKIYLAAKQKNEGKFHAELKELYDAFVNFINNNISINPLSSFSELITQLQNEKDEETIVFLTQELNENKSQYYYCTNSEFNVIHSTMLSEADYKDLMKFNTTEIKKNSITQFNTAISDSKNLHELAIYISSDYRSNCILNDQDTKDKIAHANQLYVSICVKRLFFKSEAEKYLNSLEKIFIQRAIAYLKNFKIELKHPEKLTMSRSI